MKKMGDNIIKSFGLEELLEKTKNLIKQNPKLVLISAEKKPKNRFNNFFSLILLFTLIFNSWDDSSINDSKWSYPCNLHLNTF